MADVTLDQVIDELRAAWRVATSDEDWPEKLLKVLESAAVVVRYLIAKRGDLPFVAGAPGIVIHDPNTRDIPDLTDHEVESYLRAADPGLTPDPDGPAPVASLGPITDRILWALVKAILRRVLKAA